MRLRLIAVLLLSCPLSILAADRQLRNGDQELAESFSKLDLVAAEKQAEALLLHDPKDPVALFVRMEVAELQAQTRLVLDSALRLCQIQTPSRIAEVASARILRQAGNTQIFHAMVPRIVATARQQNDCSSNLRLALVAAAADGDPSLNLNEAATSAGLLTRWQIAGSFGHYSNADFDHAWEPESDRFSHAYYGKLRTEEFLFPDGLVALPDYFSTSGIFFAASDIELVRPENSLLEVLSPGPYAVFLDGKPVFTHDSRYSAMPSRDSVDLNLNPGKHRIMIKFNADAAPFRVLIHPQSKAATKALSVAASLDGYIEGLAAYFRDDFPAMQRIVKSDSSRAADYLRALLYSAVEGHSPQARADWQALAPAALAQIKLAEIESSENISARAKALPDSESAQQAAYEILHDRDSLQRLLTLHPSCSHLSQALKVFGAAGEHEKAQKVEEQLANCAPESLLYPEVLSSAGRHSDAADHLENLLSDNPLHRTARRMLIQELLLDGREEVAKQQAQILNTIAPNSTSFARLASAPYEVLDSTSGRAAGFTQHNQFYVPYRRNGLELIRQSVQRQFAGGPAVVLLNDKVIEIRAGGSVSVYTHRITRLLNKDGIARFGEVSIPGGADLLELRTIKPTGESIEPELALQKTTTSMAALEPGHSIEEEFVTHYADWDEMPDDAVEFTFGSFTAPVLFSRLVVISPEGFALAISQNHAGQPSVEHSQGTAIQIWERNDIAQTALESDLPPENQLPSIAISPAENVPEHIRDELIAATRIGMKVEETAQGFTEPAPNDYEKARRLYRFVTGKIQSAGADWSANNAEDTLLNSEGSRTAALLALAHAGGLKAELVLARSLGGSCNRNSRFNCYTQPLVRFRFANGNVVDADAESADLPFGAVPGGLDYKDALLVPLIPQNVESHVALRSTGEEKSTAEGDLVLDESGSMTVDLHVKLGVARAQQIRALLRRTNERERRIFFDQLAIRIFPAATGVSGSSAHEDDPDQPLELILRCHVPQMIDLHGPGELDQLVPTLGLHDLYAKNSTRNFPLYIDSLLFESTSFHLHLPANIHVRSLPADFTTHTDFGDYSAQFSAHGREITIHREFRIPVQVIARQNYEAFASFARRIDEAERGRILLF